MNAEQIEWRWADANGAQNAIDGRDLVSSLSSGELPACTLVWRAGWSEWLPASQVGELAQAVPQGQREPTVKPRVTGTVKPPPAPLYKYNARLTPEAAAKLLSKSRGVTRSKPPSAPPRPNGQPRPSKAPPPFPGRAAMRSARPPPPPGHVPTPPPPPPPQRPPVPTLIEMAPAAPTGTLRPPAAVPPPPRGVPTLRTVEAAPESFQNVVTTTSTPLPPQVTATPLPTIVITDKSEALPAPVPPPDAKDAPFIAELPNPTPPPWDSEAPRPPVTGSALSTAPSSIPPPKGALFLRRQDGGLSVLAIALSAAAAVLAVTVVILLVTRTSSSSSGDEPTPAETAPSAVSSAKPQAPPPPPTRQVCSIGASPKRIAPAILLNVPPYVSQVPASQRIAIGLATSRTQAAGLTLDAASLDAARTFNQAGTAGVVGVVPLTKAGELSFAVDRDDAKLKFARTVDAKVPFLIGMNDKGVARAIGDGEPEVIFLGDPEEKITEIRVASIDTVGHAITFRRGGQSGKVLVGWLTPEGKAKTELAEVKGGEPMVGTPTLAANDGAILLAFATRADADAKWSVELGTAAHGELPRSMRRLAIPPGGPGGEAISPAATGLTKGRWFVQWTEGSSGKRQVRGQLLDRELVPIGDPLDLSPESENSGQGLVLLQNDKLVSMFLVQSGKSHELWATSLSCR